MEIIFGILPIYGIGVKLIGYVVVNTLITVVPYAVVHYWKMRTPTQVVAQNSENLHQVNVETVDIKRDMEKCVETVGNLHTYVREQNTQVKEQIKQEKEEIQTLGKQFTQIDTEAIKATLEQFITQIESYGENLKLYPQIFTETNESRDQINASKAELVVLGQEIDALAHEIKNISLEITNQSLQEDVAIMNLLTRTQHSLAAVQKRRETIYVT